MKEALPHFTTVHGQFGGFVLGCVMIQVILSLLSNGKAKPVVSWRLHRLGGWVLVGVLTFVYFLGLGYVFEGWVLWGLRSLVGGVVVGINSVALR